MIIKADPERLGNYGTSFGAILTAWNDCHSNQFKELLEHFQKINTLFNGWCEREQVVLGIKSATYNRWMENDILFADNFNRIEGLTKFE